MPPANMYRREPLTFPGGESGPRTTAKAGLSSTTGITSVGLSSGIDTLFSFLDVSQPMPPRQRSGLEPRTHAYRAAHGGLPARLPGIRRAGYGVFAAHGSLNRIRLAP